MKLKHRFITLFALLWTVQSTPVWANFDLQLLDLKQIGQVAQFTVDDEQNLLVINQRGELWQVKQQHCLLNGLSTEITPKARYGKIAMADKQGNFVLWEKQQKYLSKIPLLPNAGMEILPLATIAVTQHQQQARLVRIETHQQGAKVVAMADTPVLPDAQPIQVNLTGEQGQGHIAVLAQPDDHTYQHGVLGDKIEASELQFLERHTLKPLAKPLADDDLVFEANRLEILNTSQGQRLVTVMAGDGEGAKTVLVELGKNVLQQPSLKIVAESEALPPFRWQSPFVFLNQLYAVHMPHLAGHLLRYQLQGNRLQPQQLASGLSNHKIGRFETNITAVTQNFAVIPHMGYQQISILNKQGEVRKIAQTLPSKIIKTVANQETAYLLLENGQVWQVMDSSSLTMN